MTGRRGRVVSQSNGSIHYQLRSESDVSLEMLNVAEKQRFMDGEKVGTWDVCTAAPAWGTWDAWERI